MNINDFNAIMSKRGFQSGNKFEFFLPFLPKGADQGNEGVVRDMNFLCTSAEFPGFNVKENTVNVSSRTFSVAGSYTPTELSLKIIVDRTMNTRVVFEQWRNLIFPSVQDIGLSTTQSGIFLNFPDNYKVSGAVLNIKDESGETVRSVVFTDVYPTRVGSLNFNWESNNKALELDVGLSYFDYKVY